MIVTHYFDGDILEPAWMQHDVYREALGIIVTTCNQQTVFARGLLNDTNHRDWGTVSNYDHRTIQGAHDLLAAVWRFYNDYRQRELAFKYTNDLDGLKEKWLGWLRAEVTDWNTHPKLVRLIQLILTNQNTPPGYIAEAQICLDILDRFFTVPWDPRWRDGYQKDLAARLQKA